MCNSALPLTKLSSLTKAPLATVIVEPKTWELPTGLLTHCSPFFATALAVTHPVPKPQPIELPNVDYRAFELFVRWLYLGEITGPSWTASEPYVHAVVLGVKLECPIFKELAMIQLMDMHGHQAIDAATMDTLFTVSAEGSNLRLCAIDQFMFGACYALQTDRVCRHNFDDPHQCQTKYLVWHWISKRPHSLFTQGDEPLLTIRSMISLYRIRNLNPSRRYRRKKEFVRIVD